MSEHGLITTLMRPFFHQKKQASFHVPGAIGAKSRILCIDSGDLSEALFHLPLVTAIRRRHPQVQIDFLLPEDHAPLVVPSGLVRECILYKEGQLNPWRPAFGSLLRQLSAKPYDLALVMSFRPQPRLELAALASGAALRYGPSHKKSWPAVNFEMRPPGNQNLYLGDRLEGIAPFFGFLPGELRPGWPLPMEKIRHMAQQVHFHKPNPDQLLVGIDPGVGKTGHAFAIDNLIHLVKGLAGNLGCRLLPLGDPGAGDRLAKFETRLSGVPVGLPRETLLDMVLLVSQCDVFVAGNTDFFHLAVSLNVPTVGLFAAGEEACWEPRDRERVKVLRIKKGSRLDLDQLVGAVSAVTGGKAVGHSPLVVAAIVEKPVPAEADGAGTAEPESGETTPSSASHPDSATADRPDHG